VIQLTSGVTDVNRAVAAWLMARDLPDEPLVLEDILRVPSGIGRPACRTVVVAAYFSNEEDTRELVRAVCARCPVGHECHDVRWRTRRSSGRVGRFSEKERRVLRPSVA
jgi:Transcription factor WhiB